MRPLSFFILMIATIFAQPNLNANLNSMKPNGLQQFSFSSPPAFPFWSMAGTASITDGVVRLTHDRQSNRGLIWNSQPFQSLDFEITFSFRVWGQGTLGADGIAFWLTEKPDSYPGPFIGHSEVFKGLGIIVDTYDNDGTGDHPYLMVVYNDGTKTFNSADHDHDTGSEHNLGGCKFLMRNSEVPSKVKITFRGGTLQVQTEAHNRGFQQCMSTNLQQRFYGYYMAFSAATGQLADNHDLHSVSVISLDPNPPPSIELNDANVIAGAWDKLFIQVGKFEKSTKELGEIKSTLAGLMDVLMEFNVDGSKGKQSMDSNSIITKIQQLDQQQTTKIVQELKSIASQCSSSGRGVSSGEDSSWLPWILVIILLIIIGLLVFQLLSEHNERKKKFFS